MFRPRWSSSGHPMISKVENCYTYITYLLTAWSRVIIEKLTGPQLVQNFPEFYGTRNFITALTNTRHLSLSWSSSIQSILSHPASWISILILSPHLRLGLPSYLFPSGFPTNTLYTPLLSTIRSTNPAHLILLDSISYSYISLYHFIEISVASIRFFYFKLNKIKIFSRIKILNSKILLESLSI